MSSSPTEFYFRAYSPNIYLPQSHSELMESYKSWSTYSPKIKKRTYKKDAASLVVAWVKRILRKKLWIWRMSCVRNSKQKVDLSIKVKKPLIYTPRKVFLQVKREPVASTQRKKLIKKPESPFSEVSKVFARSFVAKPRNLFIFEKTSQEKQTAVKRIINAIESNVRFKHMEFFFTLLLLSKRFWQGKKSIQIMKGLLKLRVSEYFKSLKPRNTLAAYKVFVKETIRSVTYETSINYSPRSKNLETQTIDQSKLAFESSKFEISPLSPLENKVFPRKNGNIEAMLEQNFNNIRGLLGINQKKQNDAKAIEGDFRIEKIILRCVRAVRKNLNWAIGKAVGKWKQKMEIMRRVEKNGKALKKIEYKAKVWVHMKKSSAFIDLVFPFKKEQTQIVFLYKAKQLVNKKLKKYLQEILVAAVQKKNLQKLVKNIGKNQDFRKRIYFEKVKKNSKSFENPLRYEKFKYPAMRIAYVLKLHKSLFTILAWDSIKSYSTQISQYRSSQKSMKISFLFKVVQAQLTLLQTATLKSLKKYVSNSIFFEKNNKIARLFRESRLRPRVFLIWKTRKNGTKKICRGFELLGRFFNLKKSEILKNIRIPFPITHYLGNRYHLVSRLIFFLSKRKTSEYHSVFSLWKINNLVSVSLLQVVSIINKHISLNLFTSFQELANN